MLDIKSEKYRGITKEDILTLESFGQIMHKLVMTSELTKDEEVTLRDVLEIEEEVRIAFDMNKHNPTGVSVMAHEVLKKMKNVVDNHYHIIINNH